MKQNVITENKIHSDDNTGFSLIELLVAVAILAAVFTPIIKSFSTAAIVNSKAQRVQNATSLAESIMEDVKSKSVKNLYDEMSLTMPASPPYKISYTDVTATQGIKYDADITISTLEYANTDRNDERKNNKVEKKDDFGDVTDANLVPIPKLQDIDSSQNVVLSWEINEYDGVALEALLDKNVDDTTGAYGDEKSWWGGIRQIRNEGKGEKIVRVYLENEGSTDIKVRAEATYEPNSTDYAPVSYTIYSASFDKNEMEDVYIFYTVMKDVEEAKNRQSIAEGNGSIYFFSLQNESIEIIDNTSGHDYNVFLVVQNIEADKFEISSIDASRKTVTIKDKKDGESTVVIKNITSDANGFKISGHKTFTNFSYSIAEGGGFVYMPANLFETEVKDKIYNVKVDVKDKDGNVLATYTSTKPAGDEVN